MQKITKKIAGKEWEINVNNSGWVAPENAPELFEMLKKQPRVGVSSKHVPKIKCDDGTMLYLGAAAARLPGEEGTGGSSGGSKGSSKCPPEVLEFLLKQADKAKYPQEVKDWIASFKKPDERLVKAAKLMNKPVEEITEAELEMLKSLGMID